MPDRKAPASVLEMLQTRARNVFEIFERYFDGPTGPSDPAAALTMVASIMDQVVGVIPDLEAAALAAATDDFLVLDGQTPGPGQVTVSQFTHIVADTLAKAGAILVTDVDPVAAAIAATVPLTGINPNTWVRWYRGFLGQRVEQGQAAEDLANALIKFMVPMGDTVTSEDPTEPVGDFPSADDEKEIAFKEGTMPDISAKIVKWLCAGIVGSTSKSDAQIGQAVHKRLIAHYVNDHAGHFIVGDGRAELKVWELNLIMSRFVNRVNVASWPGADQAKAKAYWTAMRDGEKRIRPDIADLHDAATGINPKNDWGWIEIKPMHSMARAFEELDAYYMSRWNDSAAVMAHPAWRAQPAAWQPPLMGLLKKGVKKPRVYGAVTALPGCIGYLSMEVESTQKAVAAEVVAALGSILARQLFFKLRDIYRDIKDHVIRPLMLLLGLVLIAIVVWGMAEAAVVSVPFLAIASMLGLTNANLPQLLQALPQVP
jgi:hypothetical protein